MIRGGFEHVSGGGERTSWGRGTRPVRGGTGSGSNSGRGGEERPGDKAVEAWEWGCCEVWHFLGERGERERERGGGIP